MKFILPLLLLIMWSSCDKTEIEPSTPDNHVPVDTIPTIPTTLSDLILTGTKILFPYELIGKNNVAVFVNQSGEEKRMNYNYKYGMEPRAYNGLTYESEFYKVDYLDSTNLSYWLTIDVETKYSTYTQITEVVSAAILAQVNPSFISSVLINANGEPLVAKQLDQLTIAGITFTNVYTDIAPNGLGYNSFAETYYSPELGIVGFQGENGMMWALKRYEKQ